MGYVPPSRPFRPNLDRFGMPRDHATYLWATYGKGKDIPPERRAFLYGARADEIAVPDFGLQMAMR